MVRVGPSDLSIVWHVRSLSTQHSSTWVPGFNTGEVDCGEEKKWPPYLTLSTAQDRRPI